MDHRRLGNPGLKISAIVRDTVGALQIELTDELRGELDQLFPR